MGVISLISKSAYNVLKLWLKGSTRNKALKSLNEDAEKALYWLWFKHSEKENKLMQYGGSILSNLSAHYLAGNDFSTLAGLGLAVFGRADRPQC